MHTDGYEIKWIDASAHDTGHAGFGVCVCVCVCVNYVYLKCVVSHKCHTN